MDELITAQTEKIEQLQQHKKGLMQGLFPMLKINEMTQNQQLQLGKTLWAIADQLRGGTECGRLRDYCFPFYFITLPVTQLEASAKKELGSTPADTPPDVMSKLKANSPFASLV